MATTTTFNRVKAALLALTLAFSAVSFAPAVVLAAPKNSNPVHENNGKHLGQLKQAAEVVEKTPETTPADEQKAEHASSVANDKTAAPQAQKTQAASAAKSDPLGNNGTVKIDRTPFDNHPDNQPHVTCSFQVDFYGFDKGVGNADVNFELWNPTQKGRTMTVTSGDLTPNIGEDAAGGGTDLDASETYTLAFTGAPHEKQGYHVKLTVHAPGSQGADTKHKVFWVEPCATPETPENPSTVTPQNPDEGGQILGESASTTKSGAVLPAKLPSTGAGIAALLVMLVLMAVAYLTTYRSMTRNHNA